MPLVHNMHKFTHKTNKIALKYTKSKTQVAVLITTFTYTTSSIDWLIDWLINWLIDWLTDWLIDWLINLLTYLLTYLRSYLFIYLFIFYLSIYYSFMNINSASDMQSAASTPFSSW